MDLSTLVLIVFVSVLVVLGAIALAHDLRRKPLRQFGIRDLLFFTFLWALCFSLIRVQPMGRSRFTWEDDWTILATWVVLAAFYV
jgi:hypothetical protein